MPLKIIKFNTFTAKNFQAFPINTYVSPQHKVLITFKIECELNEIDFLIITAKKDGEYFPVGSVHCHDDNLFNFLDYTNVDYLGSVEYYVQPVYTTGDISSRRQKIGEVILVSKFEHVGLLKNKKKK